MNKIVIKFEVLAVEIIKPTRALAVPRDMDQFGATEIVNGQGEHANY